MGSSMDFNSNQRCVCPRKRKEHDDVAEHDFKFSKSSPVESPVTLFMKKWTEVPMTTEVIVKDTWKEQVLFSIFISNLNLNDTERHG